MPRGYGKFRTLPKPETPREFRQAYRRRRGFVASSTPSADDSFWLERARDEYLARMRNGIDAGPTFEDFITTQRLDLDGSISPTATAELQRLMDARPRRWHPRTWRDPVMLDPNSAPFLRILSNLPTQPAPGQHFFGRGIEEHIVRDEAPESFTINLRYEGPTPNG